ncbi:MAG: formimidoylglutamate deiminase [Solirubrobacterales bacterium]
MTDAYWCELAWLGGERAEAGVAIEVEAGRFASVTAGVAAPGDDARRLDGLTLPGFANAHSHAFHRALRGRVQRRGGSFWTWRDDMYALAARLDPDSYRRLARATFAEMALAGVTAVGEFHYLHHGPGGEPYADPNEIGAALLNAAREAGIRITLLDTCYLRGGIDEPLNEVQRRFADADANAWAERADALADGDGIRIGAAIHSVRAVDPGSAATVAAWAVEHGRPLHAHVSEQPAENLASLDAYGETPVAVLERAGALGPGFTAIHATHLTGADIAMLGECGGHCCLCPTTERDLADGIGPAWALDRAGASLALGSDSHAVIDQLEEARAMELDERLASNERGRLGVATLLSAATANGHAALGWPEAGRLDSGAAADLVTVRLDGVRLAGATAETALESVVFGAGVADVDRVICGGREIVRDGVHLELDVAGELRESIAAVTR